MPVSRQFRKGGQTAGGKENSPANSASPANGILVCGEDQIRQNRDLRDGDHQSQVSGSDLRMGRRMKTAACVSKAGEYVYYRSFDPADWGAGCHWRPFACLDQAVPALGTSRFANAPKKRLAPSKALRLVRQN